MLVYQCNQTSLGFVPDFLYGFRIAISIRCPQDDPESVLNVHVDIYDGFRIILRISCAIKSPLNLIQIHNV